MALSVTITSTYKFNRADDVVWLPASEYQIDNGVDLIDIEINFVPICDIMKSVLTIKGDGPKFNMSKQAITRLNELCYEEYNKTWTPAFKEFGECMGNNPTTYFEAIHKIYKRMVIWFFLAGAAIISIISGIAGSAVLIDTKISGVRNSLTETQQQIEQFRASADIQKQINGNLTRSVEHIIERVELLIESVDEFSTIVPEMQWTGMRFYREIVESSENLNKLAKRCKQKQVDTAALRKLTKLNWLEDFKPEETNLETVFVSAKNHLRLQFMVPRKDKNCSIHQLVGLNKWVNVTTNATPIIYNGPEYVLYNKTSNCTLGLEKPTLPVVYEVCVTENHTDPRLQDYKSNAFGTIPPAKIVKTKDKVFVSCLFHNITINNEIMQCPPFVFSLPKIQSFATTGKAHDVIMIKTNMTAAYKPFKFIHKSKEFQDEDLTDQIKLIQNIKNLNKQLNDVKMEKLLVQGNDSIILTILPLFIIMCMTFCILALCFNKKKGNNISIVNTPVTPAGQDENIPLTRRQLQIYPSMPELYTGIRPPEYELRGGVSIQPILDTPTEE